jgi:hypothetical protein
MSVREKLKKTGNDIKEKFKDPFFVTTFVSGAVLVGIVGFGIYKGKKYKASLKVWSFANEPNLFTVEATEKEALLFNEILQKIRLLTSEEDRRIWDLMCDRVADAVRETIGVGYSVGDVDFTLTEA